MLVVDAPQPIGTLGIRLPQEGRLRSEHLGIEFEHAHQRTVVREQDFAIALRASPGNLSVSPIDTTA